MRDVAVVVVVGRADQGAPVPGQGEDRPVLARRDDAGRAGRAAAAPSTRSGGCRGSARSAAPRPRRGSPRGRIRSAQTPVALTTFSASTSNPLAVSTSTQATPAARPSRVEQAGDLGAVQADGAEALRLAEDRQHQADVVGLAVVEEVGARAGRGRRAPAPSRPPPRPRSCGGGPAPSSSRPRSRSARSRRDEADPGRRHHVVHVEPDPDRRGCASPRPASGPGTASDRRGAARAGPSAGARAAPRGPGRGRSSAGSAARRGPSSRSGSRSRPRSRRARAAPPSSRARRRRARRPAPVIPPPITTTSKRSPGRPPAARRRGRASVEVGDDTSRWARAPGAGRSCTGRPRWSRATKRSPSASPTAARPGLAAQQLGRAPVAGEPACVRGEQDDVGGDGRACRSSSSLDSSPPSAHEQTTSVGARSSFAAALGPGGQLQPLERRRARRRESATGWSGGGSAPSGRARAAPSSVSRSTGSGR